MTIIMLAVVRVLSDASRTLNKTQGSMVMAGRVRTAQLQIERDLSNITAPLTPPLRFNDAQGYFCIIEGLGSHYGKLAHDGIIGWSLADIAANEETGQHDTTIGDCDDIIMFTARAPGDSMFRGLVGGQVVESKEAEICLFLRGTTLYRRVLLIIPDEQLQKELKAQDDDGRYVYAPNTATDRSAAQGYGFYRDFDVSARLEKDDATNEWRVKANTLADLTRRENRFGHAFRGLNTSVANPLPFPYGIHNNAAWYQLRLPTLAECTMDSTQPPVSWRMGTQIVTNTASYDMLVSQMTYDGGIDNNWDNTAADTFPKQAGKPYIDYWGDHSLPWNGNSILAQESGSLKSNATVYVNASTSTFKFKQRTNEDVLLNNVISFDVQVWDATQKKFIDLGQFPSSFPTSGNADARENAKSFGSLGYYGTSNGSTCYANLVSVSPPYSYLYAMLPAVYDTWTDAYENDATGIVLGTNGQIIRGIATDPDYDGIADIMEHVDLWRCPPPYTAPLSGIQIKIRVFDANTNNIREVAIRKNFK